MFKQLTFAGAALAMGATAILPAAPAAAQSYDRGGYYGDSYQQRGYDRGAYDRGGYDRGYDNRYNGYNSRPQYRDPCRKGTTGAIVGAIAGGLLGSAIAGRHDQGLGILLGAGGGALAGRAVERSDVPTYCRR